MMSQVIRQEALVFLAAVLHGFCLALVYDLLRALRRVFAHSSAAVSAEDFLFWIAAGFLTFCLLFLKTNGVIRGYVAVGAALGVLIYLSMFSRFVLWIVTGILGGIRTAVKTAGKMIQKAQRASGKAVKWIVRKALRPVGWALGCVLRPVRRAKNVLFCRLNAYKKIKKRIEIIGKKVYNRNIDNKIPAPPGRRRQQRRNIR